MEFHDLKSEAQKAWRQAKDKYTETIFDPKEDDYEPTKRQPAQHLSKKTGYLFLMPKARPTSSTSSMPLFSQKKMLAHYQI